jgi:hypothetical protein
VHRIVCVCPCVFLFLSHPESGQILTCEQMADGCHGRLNEHVSNVVLDHVCFIAVNVQVNHLPLNCMLQTVFEVSIVIGYPSQHHHRQH